jgi:hypothetical protein
MSYRPVHAQPLAAQTTGSEISVVAADLNDPADEDQVRGLFRKTEEIRYARVQLSADKLRENLSTFLSTMSNVVNNLPASIGSLSLETVTLSVEVSAKGTVSLLGTGGELAAKGGLTFVLKRDVQQK